jgi:hypothetical protein
LITLRGMLSPGWPTSKLLSGEVTRGLLGTQHGLSTSSAWRGVYQSDVHSHTFPVMS